jgi:hypothetical protein
MPQKMPLKKAGKAPPVPPTYRPRRRRSRKARVWKVGKIPGKPSRAKRRSKHKRRGRKWRRGSGKKKKKKIRAKRPTRRSYSYFIIISSLSSDLKFDFPFLLRSGQGGGRPAGKCSIAYASRKCSCVCYQERVKFEEAKKIIEAEQQMEMAAHTSYAVCVFL